VIKLSFYAEQFTNCCGVHEIGDFSYDNPWNKPPTKKDIQDQIGRGTGLAISNFINTRECKEAYKLLTKWFKVRYQSPAKMGKQGNKICLVVFDTKSRKSKTDPKPVWPFKDKK